MDGTTLSQFKKLFPASAVSSKLSTGKIIITLKLKNFWGNSTLNDLKKLVSLFGIPGSRLHLEKIGDGSVAVHWLCSTIDAKDLKIAIVEVTDSLQTKGVLQVFIGEELVLEIPQSAQGNDWTVLTSYRISQNDFSNKACLMIISNLILY